MPEHITTIRAPREDEFESWAPLFRAYRAFYDLAADEAVVERVWSWIHSPAQETNALIAVTNDAVTVGLAHYRRFARPSTGTVGIYLDDLLTDPAHRGTGIGRALIEAVTEIGAEQGCSILRWITAADNAHAQKLYNTIATRTTWLTYDKPCR
jgi:GNAT superfamily N-acetyltransferase